MAPQPKQPLAALDGQRAKIRDRCRRAFVATGLISIYFVLRLALIPSDPSLTYAFSHDSGYISIVARNILSGKGMVNDAHWLLFLNPLQLPMAFHNANPLYVLLCAWLAQLLGTSTPYAGCVVSIMGNVLLGIGAYFLTLRFYPRHEFAFACAAAAMVFPSNWQESFAVLPDALATGLSFCTLAVIVWASRSWGWVAAGAVFGLAWLTRSTAFLLLPSIAVWVLARRGLRNCLVAGSLFTGAAVAVMSPWLYHTNLVRGSPLASDVGYYWLQDFYASTSNRTIDQYWRSLTAPPPAGETIRARFSELAVFTLKGIPRTAYFVAAELTDWNKFRLLLLLLAACASGWMLRSRWRTAELVAVTLLVAATLLSVAVRSASTEVRYFGVVNTLLAVLILLAFTAPRPRWLLVPVVAYALCAVVPQDFVFARRKLAVDPALVAYSQAALRVSQSMPAGEAAVVVDPYFFTYFTGRPSISPPYPGKAQLLDVMRRYGATRVFLPSRDLDNYYVGAPESLRPELELTESIGVFVLFRTGSGM